MRGNYVLVVVGNRGVTGAKGGNREMGSEEGGRGGGVLYHEIGKKIPNMYEIIECMKHV